MTKDNFIHLILPAKDKLFRTALMLLQNHHEAEDTLQDTMLKLWNMRDRLSEYQNVEALAVTMIKNLCLDKLRSYQHRRQNTGEPDMASLVSDGVSPLGRLELGESLMQINSIVEMLTEQQQLLFTMREIEHRSYAEMQNATGLTVNNIRVNLSRIRQKIRDEIIKLQDDEKQPN